MGVDFYHCDGCGDCRHEDAFWQCQTCDERLDMCDRCCEDSIIPISEFNQKKYINEYEEPLESITTFYYNTNHKNQNYKMTKKNSTILCDDCLKDYWIKYNPNDKRDNINFRVSFEFDVKNDGKRWKLPKMPNKKWYFDGGESGPFGDKNEKPRRTEYYFEKDKNEEKTREDYNDFMFYLIKMYEKKKKKQIIKNIKYDFDIFNL